MDQFAKRVLGTPTGGLSVRPQSGRSSIDVRATHLQKRPRHAGIFEALARCDAQLDEAGRRQLVAWIRDQYASEYGDIPLGMVSRCYLGPPFVDHTLSLLGEIVEHYAPTDTMPEPFQSARMLARSDDYVFVEVYANGRLVPVTADGTAI